MSIRSLSASNKARPASEPAIQRQERLRRVRMNRIASRRFHKRLMAPATGLLHRPAIPRRLTRFGNPS